MGTLAASRVLDRAAKTLLDETGVQWAPSELLDYLNAGNNAIVANKPDTFMKNAAVQLTVNSSKQVIPSDGYQFVDAVANAGSNASSPVYGRAVRQVERNHLDRSNPNWHTEAGTEVKHFMHDKRDPKVFWVHPRPSSASALQVIYAAHPPAVNDPSDVLPLDDLYENALHSFVVGYAYMKNSKRGDMNKANAYFTMFANAIGVKSQVQFAFAPIPADADERSAREPT